MSETTTHACRWLSPDGEPCVRPRGHKGKRHRHKTRTGREFDADRNGSHWRPRDSGHMSEADYQTWGRWA